MRRISYHLTCLGVFAASVAASVYLSSLAGAWQRTDLMAGWRLGVFAMAVPFVVAGACLLWLRREKAMGKDAPDPMWLYLVGCLAGLFWLAAVLFSLL